MAERRSALLPRPAEPARPAGPGAAEPEAVEPGPVEPVAEEPGAGAEPAGHAVGETVERQAGSRARSPAIESVSSGSSLCPSAYLASSAIVHRPAAGRLFLATPSAGSRA